MTLKPPKKERGEDRIKPPLPISKSRGNKSIYHLAVLAGPGYLVTKCHKIFPDNRIKAGVKGRICGLCKDS